MVKRSKHHSKSPPPADKKPRYGRYVRTEAIAIRVYLAVLCLLAAGRIFLGAAGVPLFTNVDEDRHFDLVRKYARGCWPDNRHLTLDRETAEIQSWYASNEFLLPQKDIPPPLWSWPDSAQKDAVAQHLIAEREVHMNYEAQSPPVYYALAAAWYDMGQLGGLRGPRLAYWVRFLNIPLYAALIVATYGFCRAFFPRSIALAAPLLLAFFPNTTFFSINSDVFSPLMMVLALWLLLRWHFQPDNTWLAVAVGLAVSAAVLVKLSNVAVVAVCGAVVLSCMVQAWKAGQFGQACRKALLLIGSAGAPLVAWMLRNRLVLGDWTGNTAKLRFDWHVKPWGQVLHHPLFSFAGQWTFWSGLVTSFYGGEVFWNGNSPMNSLPTTIFLFFFVAFVAMGLMTICVGRGRVGDVSAYRAGMASAVVIGLSILLLMFLSMRFDFGNCFYPSRHYPYLTSGRLISGALAPVVVLYLYGVMTATRRSKWAMAIVVGISVLMMALPQIAFLAQVLKSRYNWFHIP